MLQLTPRTFNVEFEQFWAWPIKFIRTSPVMLTRTGLTRTRTRTWPTHGPARCNQWRRSQVKSGGIKIKSEGVGSGRGCALPSWGSGGLHPEKNQICAKNYAILSKFWYFFPILQHKNFQHAKIVTSASEKVGGDYHPSPESGGPIPLLRRLWVQYKCYRQLGIQIRPKSDSFLSHCVSLNVLPCNYKTSQSVHIIDNSRAIPWQASLSKRSCW